MNSTKTMLMFLGLISGMVFVYSLDVLTATIPAELEHHFKSYRILRYDITAEIDNLTVLEKGGRKVPVRYKYGEDMELNCYYFHTKHTGRRVVMMELISKKIRPESIEVAGKDETARLGPGFARRVPPPGYIFLNFEQIGLIPGQRRASTIRDMIVSTYHVRSLKKGQTFTKDVWEGEMDMGPFVTTYKWRFNNLKFDEKKDQVADISGGGEFYAELPDGVKGKKLGSYTYSYTIGVGVRNKHEGYIRNAEGSFDIASQYAEMGTSYREKFVQKIKAIESVPRNSMDKFRDEMENLKNVMAKETLGDTQAFHDGLVMHLRTHPESPIWENLLALLNGLREKCGEEPVSRKDILKEEENDSD